MMRYTLAILLTLFTLPSWAEEHAFEGLQLDKPPVEFTMESIKRGATFFAANCMTCHTLTYLRYDDVAKGAGISPDKTPKNLVFNGVSPPDLSLITSARGVNWVYTYLHSFYQDSKQASGVNNLLLPNTAMPNQLAPFQGDQVLVDHPLRDFRGSLEWYDLLKLTKQGSMSSDEFDHAMADLVNFLAYAAEPYRLEQRQLGWWVLGFIAIMFVLLFFLKKEYWKDVKRKDD